MVECVRTAKEYGEKAVKLLREFDLLSREYKVKAEGGYVYLPVSSRLKAIEALRSSGVPAEPCETSFRPRRKRVPRLSELGFRVTGYQLIGDIAVFSRRAGGPSLEEYADAGRTLLDSNPKVRSVWLKEYTEGEWRVQRLIHLAGERRTETIHKEYGLQFRVDIAKTYFNPRLAFEHRRVAEMVSDGEKVLDMFSGVGGFSIHIASLSDSHVVAVDLNPHAALMASYNVKLNRAKLKGRILVVRSDASMLPSFLDARFTRIIMNHPTASKMYARTACSLLARRGEGHIHFYILSISCGEALEQAYEAFNGCCEVEDENCRLVLDYAPGSGVYVVDLKAKHGI